MYYKFCLNLPLSFYFDSISPSSIFKQIKTDDMKIALVQYDPVWENKEANKEKLMHLLDSVSEKVDLFVFPEMTLTGFTMKSALLGEVVDEDTFIYFRKIAKKKSSHIVAGMIAKEGDKIFNSLIHVNRKGALESIYHKIHPFSSGGEDLNYSKGTKPVVTNIDDWKAGLSICYDLRFPELYRCYGKERVHLMINIANWPNTRIEHWRTLLKARAIENQCYVVGVSRVGNDPKNLYNGFSSIFGPIGEEVIVLVGEEKIGIVEIEIEKVNGVRNQLPFLNDITLI
jgi:predicted amidohydrolase